MPSDIPAETPQLYQQRIGGTQTLAIIAVALVSRAVFLLQFRESPYYQNLSVDAEAFDQWAWRIAQGDWIGDAVFYRDPLFPYVLGTSYRWYMFLPPPSASCR